MTPEQDETWRATIMPVALGVVEGYELSQKGLRESALSLRERGVPGWAAQLRIAFLSRTLEPWYPGFAIHSETALVGIQLQTPGIHQKELYQRVFIRFAGEALRPIIDHARQVDDTYRQTGYRPLITLFQLCESFTQPADLSQWPLAADLFPPRGFHYGMPETIEIYHAGNMGAELLRLIHQVLGLPGTGASWGRSHLPFEGLIDHLNQMYQWHTDGKVATSFAAGPSYRQQIASAYLTALEAECPAPAWLPRE